MAKQFDQITSTFQTFIEKQKMFFVATARDTGRINLSPKGMDSLRVLGPNRVMWLNLTGSGNETATHLIEDDRMTIMFCAFEGKPLIYRLYGHTKVYHITDPEWEDYIGLFPESPGARQLMDMTVDMAQTSCGWSIPFMDFQEERKTLQNWAEKKGKEGVRQYWQKGNAVSLDGHLTGIPGLRGER